jgi:hypothetical protein
MVRKLLFVFVLFPLLSVAQNQEIATFVSYNVLNYRNETTYCTNANNSPMAKEGYMKSIFGDIQPDLLACNEVGANPTNAVKILERCLNVDGETKYQMASFSSSSGSSLANAFFYNGEMFTLYTNDKILNEVGGNSLVRLIDVFTLYYNDGNLPLGADTTFLTVFIGHFKAGNSSSDATRRASTTEAIMAYISSNNISGNYIVTGDFNTYNSSEVAIQNLVNPSNAAIKFVDPVNRMGSWNNNFAYADVHTQSTHTTSNGCASGGGLDDRFDFVMVSQDLMADNDHMEYVNNSYKALANDGNHFNQAINDLPNNSVSSALLDAVYNASDHLPVIMDIIITEAAPNGINEFAFNNFEVNVVNPSKGVVSGVIKGDPGSYSLKLYSITGSLISEKNIKNSGSSNFSFPINFKGLVLLQVESESGYKKVFKIVQN